MVPLFRALAAVVPRIDGNVLDVGAYIGEFLLIFLALRSDPRYRYLAFEPSVNAANYLQSLIAANQIDGAEVLPIALSDHFTVCHSVQGCGVCLGRRY